MANLLKDSTINYYEILDVSPQATDQEVYQSYIRIKKAYSLRNPELFRNFSLDEIQQLLLYIEEAYATIGNPQSRRLYDVNFFKLQPAMHFQETSSNEESSNQSPPPSFDMPSFDMPSFGATSEEGRSLLSIDADSSTETAMNPPGVQKAMKPSPDGVSNSSGAGTSKPAPSTSVPKISSPSIPPPEGFASTATSLYEIDPAFESLIEGQQFFDGIFLSKVRKYKKVKLEDFSQQTCISIRYLYAIENNNYSALPASVFVRGYINQYCKILNIDSERVITSFMKLYHNGRE